MPVTIDQLTEGYWWAQIQTQTVIVRLWRIGGNNDWVLSWNRSAEEDNALQFLDQLIAPVAPYREKNTLVVIGCLGLRRAYINVPRDQAIERYLKTEDQDQLGSYEKVDEYTFIDELWAYDVSGDRE